MKLTVLLTKPEFTVDISTRDILSCSSQFELMEMVRGKLKHALTEPKYWRVDPLTLTQIVTYWNNYKDGVTMEEGTNNSYGGRDDNYDDDYRGFKHN